MQQEWPADKPERRKVADLIPYANNARTHSEQQVSQIAASINEWGFTNPVLVDETGMIIAGHGRILAAQKLGMDEVPTIRADGWSEAQKKAYILADNQLALNAGWDFELIGIELEHIEGLGFDATLIGFDPDTLSDVGLSLYDGGSGEEFKEFDENVETEHECPKCGYSWSGTAGIKEKENSKESPIPDSAYVRNS